MSSVQTQSRYDSSRHLSFISTSPYHNNFYTYTYYPAAPSNSFVAYGALTKVKTAAGADVVAADCPAGRILRTNGRKIYPDSSAIPVSALADRSPLVGVIDYSTGLSGFVDPNQTMFAIYSVDKAVDGASEESSLTLNRNTHKGMSVYTGGNVTAAGNVSADGSISAGTSVTAGNSLTVTAGDFTVTSGKVFLNVTAGNATVGTATLTSTTPVVIATTAVRAGSKIFLTKSSASGAAQGTPYVGTLIANTSFAIVSTGATDTSTVNWLIIN
jgi:hypothetical protein